MFFRDQQTSIKDKLHSRKKKETSQHQSAKRLSQQKNIIPSTSSNKHQETPMNTTTHETLWTPTTIQNQLQTLIASSPELASPLWVKGEINNCSSRNRSGHMYFDIQDECGNKLSCTLFGVHYIVPQDIQERLENGVLVKVKGKLKCISKYKGSQYQCNVRQLNIMSNDSGMYEQQLKEWKTTLQQEGLFDASHKQALPSYAQHVAVITSQDGAAWQDVRQTIENTHIPLQIQLYPCLVQGEKCVSSILQHLETICELDLSHKPDIVLITRGGGSREDLWEFNRQSLARGVHALRNTGQLPCTVCAIGHQTDTPLLDYVCDASFITPTYSAQHIVQPYVELNTSLVSTHRNLTKTIQNLLKQKHEQYVGLFNLYNNIRYIFYSIYTRTYKTVFEIQNTTMY